MIAPGSIADWTVFAGMLGSLSALAASAHRWVLQEAETPEPIPHNMTTLQCDGPLHLASAHASDDRS